MMGNLHNVRAQIQAFGQHRQLSFFLYVSGEQDAILAKVEAQDYRIVVSGRRALVAARQGPKDRGGYAAKSQSITGANSLHRYPHLPRRLGKSPVTGIVRRIARDD